MCTYSASMCTYTVQCEGLERMRTHSKLSPPPPSLPQAPLLSAEIMLLSVVACMLTGEAAHVCNTQRALRIPLLRAKGKCHAMVILAGIISLILDLEKKRFLAYVEIEGYILHAIMFITLVSSQFSGSTVSPRSQSA